MIIGMGISSYVQVVNLPERRGDKKRGGIKIFDQANVMYAKEANTWKVYTWKVSTQKAIIGNDSPFPTALES